MLFSYLINLHKQHFNKRFCFFFFIIISVLLFLCFGVLFYGLWFQQKRRRKKKKLWKVIGSVKPRTFIEIKIGRYFRIYTQTHPIDDVTVRCNRCIDWIDRTTPNKLHFFDEIFFFLFSAVFLKLFGFFFPFSKTKIIPFFSFPFVFFHSQVIGHFYYFFFSFSFRSANSKCFYFVWLIFVFHFSIVGTIETAST